MPDDLERTFLAAIQRDADPRLTQRIYADWLEEQGDARAILLRQAAAVRDCPGDVWIEYVGGDSPCQSLWEQAFRLIGEGEHEAAGLLRWARLARLPDGWKDFPRKLWKWSESGARDESGAELIKRLGLTCSASLEHRALTTLEAAADPRPIQTWYADWLEPHDDLRAALLRQAVTIRSYPRDQWVDLIDGKSLCSQLWDAVLVYLDRRQVSFQEFYQWARIARIPNGWRKEEQSAWKWNELEMQSYE